jgi:hypothetical protein
MLPVKHLDYVRMRIIAFRKHIFPRNLIVPKFKRPKGLCVKSVLEQKKEDWRLDDEQIVRAVLMISLDNAEGQAYTNMLKLFLYAKEIRFDERSLFRIGYFDDLLNPDSSGLGTSVVEKLWQGRSRLACIVHDDEKGSDFLNGNQTMFDKFVQDHPEWSVGNSFVIFRDHEKLSGKPRALVEKFQLRGGLCYMHAPIVLQHYLVAMQRYDHVPMLDLALYLRRFMSSNDLKRHVWDNIGGDSKQFLKSILLPNSDTICESRESNLLESLHKYGPGLVQGFQVEDAFINSRNWQYLGRRKGEFIGLHAMVLVGIRKEGESFRFLLQNWWKFKPFVEVDISYMNSCEAVVRFVITPQHKMGDFPTNLYDHVECELLDAPENFAPEMQ